MNKWIKLERILFYGLVFLLFFQGRLIWYSFRPEFNEWTSAYLYVTDILFLAVIFLWLARSWKKIDKLAVARHLKQPLELALAVFLLIDLGSVFLSDNFWLSFYGFIKLLEFVILFLYVRYNFSELFSLKKFWQVFVASASLQSVVALLQFFWQKGLGLTLLFESPLGQNIAGVAKIDLGVQKIIRAYGLAPHPNILAAVIILAIFGLAYLFIKSNGESKKRTKIILGADLALLSSALFFTFSRAVTLIGFGFLALWLTVIFWRQKELRRPVLFFLISLSFVFCLLSIAYWPLVSARYDIAGAAGSQALNLRAYYNEQATGLIKDAPLFGAGQSNFVWTTTSRVSLSEWMYQPVHNIYLLIGAETGIFGLVFFVGFLLVLWRSAKRTLLRDCLIYIFYFIITIGLVDHFWWDLQQGQIMFWLFLGIFASFIFSPHGSTDKAQPSEG